MDVETAITLASSAASAAAGGAATAAGENAWRSLVALARRAVGAPPAAPAAPGRGSEARPADALGPDAVDPADGDAVHVLNARIAERARADEEFAAELCRWAEEHRAAVEIDRSGEVHNTVSGEARVDGPVIQARDIHGGIHL